METFETFLSVRTILEAGLLKYKISKRHERNQYEILFPNPENEHFRDVVKLEFINYDSKKGRYEAKMSFYGGEKILKNMKLDYDSSAEEVQRTIGDKLVKSLCSYSKFQRSFEHLFKQ